MNTGRFEFLAFHLPTVKAKTTYEYNAALQPTKTRRKTSPTGADNDATDHLAINTYSATTGRLTNRTSAGGDVTDYEYDIYGRLKKTILPDDSYTENLFDGNGRVTRTTRSETGAGGASKWLVLDAPAASQMPAAADL